MKLTGERVKDLKKLFGEACPCGFEVKGERWGVNLAPTPECVKALLTLESKLPADAKRYLSKHIKTEEPELRKIVERMRKSR